MHALQNDASQPHFCWSVLFAASWRLRPTTRRTFISRVLMTPWSLQKSEIQNRKPKIKNLISKTALLAHMPLPGWTKDSSRLIYLYKLTTQVEPRIKTSCLICPYKMTTRAGPRLQAAATASTKWQPRRDMIKLPHPLLGQGLKLPHLPLQNDNPGWTKDSSRLIYLYKLTTQVEPRIKTSCLICPYKMTTRAGPTVQAAS